MPRVLSGIQPTGRFHWGNYFGAIRQYIDLQDKPDTSFYFIADLHALEQQYPSDTGRLWWFAQMQILLKRAKKEGALGAMARSSNPVIALYARLAALD